MAFAQEECFDLDDDDFLFAVEEISCSGAIGQMPVSLTKPRSTDQAVTGSSCAKRKSFELVSSNPASPGISNSLPASVPADDREKLRYPLVSINPVNIPPSLTHGFNETSKPDHNYLMQSSFRPALPKFEFQSASSSVIFGMSGKASQAATEVVPMATSHVPVNVASLFKVDDSDLDLSLGRDDSNHFSPDVGAVTKTRVTNAADQNIPRTSSVVCTAGIATCIGGISGHNVSRLLHTASSTTQLDRQVIPRPPSIATTTGMYGLDVISRQSPMPAPTVTQAANRHSWCNPAPQPDQHSGMPVPKEMPTENVNPSVQPASCTSVFVESSTGPLLTSPRDITAPSSVDNQLRNRKRKFPGPAGSLPKLRPGVNMMESSPVQAPSLPSCVPPTQSSEQSSSQSQEHGFTSAAWHQMKRDLEPQASQLLTQFNLSNIYKKAQRRQLSGGRVPVVCVVIDTLSTHNKDTSATFKDQTGVMQGTIHRQLMKEHQTEMIPGAVLVLRQVGIFSPSDRSHYLNVTPNNLVRLYTSQPNESIVEKTVSSFDKEDFIVSPPQQVTPSTSQGYSSPSFNTSVLTTRGGYDWTGSTRPGYTAPVIGKLPCGARQALSSNITVTSANGSLRQSTNQGHTPHRPACTPHRLAHTPHRLAHTPHRPVNTPQRPAHTLQRPAHASRLAGQAQGLQCEGGDAGVGRLTPATARQTNAMRLQPRCTPQHPLSSNTSAVNHTTPHTPGSSKFSFRRTQNKASHSNAVSSLPIKTSSTSFEVDDNWAEDNLDAVFLGMDSLP